MRNIKLLLEYDGSRYDGWMPAKGKKDSLSVSEKVTAVLERMTGERITLQEAVRTEAGVHALGQVANFRTACPQKFYEIKNYLNQYLPKDIAVLSVSEVPERFHSTLAPKRIAYEYRIATGEVESVFERKYKYYSFTKPDAGAMRKGAAFLLGRHDFRAFSENRKMKKSTVREFYEAEIYGDINEVSIRLTADDFWPGLARNVAGVLIEIGKGRLRPEAVEEALNRGSLEPGEAVSDARARAEHGGSAGAESLVSTKTESFASTKAEARGLFLAEVEYL